MFQDAASTKELVVVVGVEVVLRQDGLLLVVLSVGLVEGVEFPLNDMLAWEVVGFSM